MKMELNYTTTPPSSYSKIGPNMKDNGYFGTQSIKIEENDVMIEQDVIVSPIRTRVTTVINDNYSPQIVIVSDNLGSTQIIKNIFKKHHSDNIRKRSYLQRIN